MLRALKTAALPGLALALVVTGCGSSSKSSNPAADLALAKGSVLTETDAPSGYTAAPHQSSGDLPEPVKRDFANCIHTDATILDVNGQHADGPDFNDGNDGSIENSVEIMKTKSITDKEIKAIQQPSVPNCLGKLFDTAIKAEVAKDPQAQGATFGAVTVTPLPVPGVGDKSAAFRARVPISAGGNSAVFYADTLFVQRGRAGITLQASKIGEAPDQSLENQLASKMVNRLGAKAP